MEMIDLYNKKLGRLTVINRAESSKLGKARWNCRCDCGNTICVIGVDLRNGHTSSCGCKQLEAVRKTGLSNVRHGHSTNRTPTPTYETWRSMKQRCYSRTHKSFRYYREKGIQVCSRWFNYENFLRDMGERPKGKTIDRINGNWSYMPSNCRWATPLEQRHNWSNAETLIPAA